MREGILTLTAAVVLDLATLSSQIVGATVTVDVNTKYQTISGFGASTAWASSMSATDADLLWSTTTGAGLSLHRIRIGGGSTSETSIAKLAVARGVKVWAAPWEVKSSDISGNPPKLINAQDWANTLVSFLTNMKNQGVPIYALSAENEPDSKGLNSTTWYTADEMATWVGNTLGPALAATDTKLMAPETMNFCGLSTYLPALQNNANAWKYTSIIATHEYGCSPKAYPQIAQAGKEFWETEIYDTDGNEDAGMGSALRTYKVIHEALTIANMNAWHFWWVYPCCNDNGALWDKATNKPSKRLWVMGNYSRFVRPGYVRVSATAAPTSGVTLTAYFSSKDNKVVIVAANTNSSATSQAFSLSNASATKVTPWVTDNSSSLAAGSAITPSANSFTYSLPAQSVTSLVVDIAGTSVFPLSKPEATRCSAVKVHCGKALLTIEFEAPKSGLTSVKLFNLNGTIVKAMTFRTITGGTYSRRFDLADLPEGFYMVKIDNASNGYGFLTGIATSR
jgi:glucuronoarabinoxylan endo-1,4-beta-xylanase